MHPKSQCQDNVMERQMNLVPAATGHWLSWKCSYTWLEDTVWVLGTEPWCSGKATSAPVC